MLLFAFNVAIFGISALIRAANGLGCIPEICAGYENSLRQCVHGGTDCAGFGDKRWNEQVVHGIDLQCAKGNLVRAPFNGTLSAFSPIGNQACNDVGIRVDGEGQWQGFFATLGFFQPYRLSGRVEQGEIIGQGIDVRCNPNDNMGQISDFVQFHLFKAGEKIDPTTHLKDCMCTGQICESNNRNEFQGRPFRVESEFGKGFEIKCPNLNPNPENRPPIVFSPIEGKRLGRVRLRNPALDPSDCRNDGVFIVGKGAWEDFTVHIYNAKFLKHPGEFEIKQGDPVAQRLDCPAEPRSGYHSAVDSVFVEFRFRGRLVNITEQILGFDCKMPQFY